MSVFRCNTTNFARLDIDAEQCVHVDNGDMILALCGAMSALACVTLIARVYTRGWMTHSTSRDDYTMWIAVSLSVAGFAVIVLEVYGGAGRYRACLSPEDLRRSLLLQFIRQPLYVWSILFVKVSITFCLLRFAPSKTFSRFLWGCMIFFTTIALMYFTSLMLQCRPMSMLWDPSIKDGTCMTPSATRAFGYINAAISLFVDLLLATLPIPMIWNIQVGLHVKVAIAFVMSLGGLAAAACAVRIHYLTPSTLTGDVLFDPVVLTIWTAVECNVAIIAASVPSIIPLIKKCHELTRKGTIRTTVGRSIIATGDIEQGSKSSPGIKSGTQRKSSMQQDLLIDSERNFIRRDMIPIIRIEEEEESPADTEDDDISQLYANALRNVTKRSVNGFQHSGLSWPSENSI